MAEIKKISTEFQLLDKFLDTSGDAGTSGQVLSSTATGINWVSGSSLPGGPYLPLAGGTMTGTNGVVLPDNFILNIGTANDLTIKHNATNSFIENHTGDLSIVNYANDKDLVLWNDDGTGGIAKYLVLDGNTTHAYFSNPGNVGIGTTSPSSKLDVLGPDASTGTIKWQNGGSRRAGYLYSDSGGVAIYDTALSEAGIYIMSNLRIDFRVNGGEKMRIDSSGNVGIADTSPSFKLDVNVTSSRARFKATTGNADIELSSIDGHDWLMRSMSDDSFAIYDEDAATERMRITSTGNVGIGTTSPGYKLDVNGSVNTAFGATNGYRINTNRVLSQVPGGVEIGVLDYKTTYPNISFNNDNTRSEEHTSELQSRLQLVCRLLLETKKEVVGYQPK